MFMVALNDGNCLQQTITLVLIFCETSKNPRTIVCEKKKRKQNKTKKQTGSQAKEDDIWQGI